MLESAWLFVGGVAFVWTLLTVIGAVVAAGRGETGDALATVAGVVGFVLWGVWSFGSLNIIVVGEVVTYHYAQPELALVGIVLALVPGYIALTGPIELISRWRETEPRDV